MHFEPYQQSSPELGPWLNKPLGHSDFEALPEFKVEQVLQEQRRKAKNGRQVPEYLIRFVGYDATYDKWLTRKATQECPRCLTELGVLPTP